MKKSIILIGLSALCMTSCVTLGKYEALESRNAQLRREFNTSQSELSDLRDENADLQRQNQSLNTQITDLNDLRNNLQDSIASMKRNINNLKMGYDTVIENYNQRITGQSQDLTRTNNLLAARTKELSDKEAAFQLKEAAFQAKEAEFRTKESEFQTKEATLLAKQTELENKEAETRRALEAKERELENLRTKLNNALVGFADKGLNVETRDGKVYVSMDSKLLFPSASWTVSKDGIEALKTLATVLEQNTDLNIMVEGHTDNAAFKGSTAVKDNWDLSVMRATSIVKMLLKYGPSIDPARIEACGHAEFAPKVPNDTPANNALNRRTEIILTPKMSDILKMIDK